MRRVKYFANLLYPRFQRDQNYYLKSYRMKLLVISDSYLLQETDL